MEIMLDFENEIFTKGATALRSAHKGITVLGEYIRRPSKFPTATISEFDNVSVDELIDSSDEEKYAGLGYRLQVFSNKTSGKKAEAKAIFDTADKVIVGLGFRRKTYNPTPDIYESTIYSITATYEAIVDKNGVIYKR